MPPWIHDAAHTWLLTCKCALQKLVWDDSGGGARDAADDDAERGEVGGGGGGGGVIPRPRPSPSAWALCSDRVGCSPGRHCRSVVVLAAAHAAAARARVGAGATTLSLRCMTPEGEINANTPKLCGGCGRMLCLVWFEHQPLATASLLHVWMICCRSELGSLPPSDTSGHDNGQAIVFSRTPPPGAYRFFVVNGATHRHV